MKDTPSYPQPPRSDVVDDYHGTTVADPFRPLEDPRSPETTKWAEAQEALTNSFLADHPGREALAERVRSWTRIPRVAQVDRNGGTTAWLLRQADQEQYVLIVGERPGDPDARVLFDPANDDASNAITEVSVSPNGRYVAWGVNKAGSDWQSWHIHDLEEDRRLNDVLDPVKFPGLAWFPDSSGFLYGQWPQPDNPLEDANENHRLMLHRFGDDRDAVVHHDPAEPHNVYLGQVLEDGEHVAISVRRSAAGETALYLGHLTDDGSLKPIFPDFDARHLVIGEHRGRLLVLTDRDAINGRVVSVDPTNPSDIRAVVAPTGDVIQNAHLAGDWLVIVRLVKAQAQVSRFNLAQGGLEELVDLPAMSSVSWVVGDEREPSCLLLVDSFERPAEVLHLDAATGALQVAFEPRLETALPDVVCEQVAVRSVDGTAVTVFLVHDGKAGDHPRRTVLYGYGGFNIPITPRFSSAIHSWVDRGGIFAMANLRGGSEYGKAWHEAGMRKNKQNVFDDLHSVARWLIAQGYTTTPHLAIQGRSNGGLLVGACLTQQPELYGAALPSVGVLDMLRYDRFTVGRLWAHEYGSAQDPDMFPTLLAYSPLHNVRDGVAYPPTMISTADRDDRVVPAHSYKFAARMQEAQGGEAPVLLRVERSGGHGAGSAASQQVERIVDEWSFLELVLAPEA